MRGSTSRPDPGDKVTSAAELHAAVALENASTIESLVEARCDINGVDKKGWTGLHVASSLGSVPIVQRLLGLGAKETEDRKGRRPVDVAAEYGQVGVVQFFREARVNSRSRNQA
uniref:Uncharacterized protein n=1 Tax=Oxyrrhis marina TaxID=2969 RepID=A0A7S3XJN4_OXYMA